MRMIEAQRRQLDDLKAVFKRSRIEAEAARSLILDKVQVGGAVTVGVMENFAVTLEYLNGEDYDTGEGGTGNHSHTATVELAAEF